MMKPAQADGRLRLGLTHGTVLPDYRLHLPVSWSGLRLSEPPFEFPIGLVGSSLPFLWTVLSVCWLWDSLVSIVSVSL